MSLAQLPGAVTPAEPLAKPCECGCGRVLRVSDFARPFHWRNQRFASRGCGMRWRNRHDPTVIEGRRKGAKSAVRATGHAVDDERGAIVTPPSWLNQPLARIRLQRQAHGIVA